MTTLARPADDDLQAPENAERYFENLYLEDGEDPWGFRTRWYEARKRAIVLALLPAARYAQAYEPACANGELAAALAVRCDRLLASDFHARAVALARERLAASAHVRVEQRRLPEQWPEGEFDLVVLSELGYYLAPSALAGLVERAWQSLRRDGCLLACHWRHPIDGFALTGDAVHRQLAERCGDAALRYEEADFRIDVWLKRAPAAASERMPLLAVSAHLDDAALSCGWLLAREPGSVVVTLFAGLPDEADLITPWDRACGFTRSREAILARRQEDQRFADAIGAQAIWLGFLDGQYQRAQPFEAAVLALRRVFEAHAGHRLLLPLGLIHPDHRVCHAAALAATTSLRAASALRFYEDVPYRSVAGALAERRGELQDGGLVLRQRETFAGERPLKAALLAHYASQWPRLETHEVLDSEDCFAPECLWQCDGQG